MTKIFLSYAHPDRDRVNAIKMLLELGGATVFLDWQSVEPGTAWEAKIEAALTSCDILCVFWTSSTPESEWVPREYETFLAKYPERQCIPLRADETPLPAKLAARQAPPGILALCSTLLAYRRDLIALRLPPKDIDRLVRAKLKELAKALGIVLNDSQWKTLSLGFGAGVIAVVGRRAIVAIVGKIVAGVLAVGAFAGVLWLRCETNKAPDDAATSPDSGSSTPPRTDASRVIDAVSKPDIATDSGKSDPACPSIPVDAGSEDPMVSNLTDPICAVIDKVLRSAQRDYADICMASIGLLHTTIVVGARWSSTVSLDSAGCTIVHTTKDDLLLCQFSPTADTETIKQYIALDHRVSGCLSSNQGWDAVTIPHESSQTRERRFTRKSAGYYWSEWVSMGADDRDTGMSRVGVSLSATRLSKLEIR